MYEVLKYIHANINKDLTLSEVAEKFRYSKWHFSTKFHNYTGKLFTKHLRHFRLSHASIDILDGKKIIDIAYEYGYDSVGGFNKAFVSEFGCYPSEHKNNAKEALLYYERRKASMYQLTERCEILKKRVTGTNDYEDYYAVQYKREILAYSLSPMQGRDFNGLTSLFNSLSKLPTKRTPGTTSAIVEIDPKLFTDRNIPPLANLLYAAGSTGLQNVQFNTVDADIFSDAKIHPESTKILRYEFPVSRKNLIFLILCCRIILFQGLSIPVCKINTAAELPMAKI